MKNLTAALILTLGLTTTAFSQDEFLPGMLKMRGENIALRAVCAEKSGNDECTSFHFHKIGPNDSAAKPSLKSQITPYALSFGTLENLKANGFFFNIFSPEMDGSSNVGELEGINLIWIPLLAPVDAVGYTIGTPLYSGYKLIENIKYRKLLRFLKTGKTIELYSQGFQIVEEEICDLGHNATLKTVIEEIRNEIHESGEALRERDILLRAKKRIDRCGFRVAQE